MDDRKLKIGVFGCDNGALHHYRLRIPLEEVQRQGLSEVFFIPFSAPISAYQQGVECDVVVWYSMPPPAMIPVMRDIQAEGVLLVHDYDDNPFAVNPLSPHYLNRGEEEYSVVCEGKVLKIWEDGRDGFNIAKNKKHNEEFRDALRKADLVTTAAPVNATRLRRFNPNVAVLPDCLNLEKWNRLDMKPHEDIRLFWSGGHSHHDDWRMMQDVLPEIFNRYPQVHLHVMGKLFEGPTKTLDQSRVHFHEWEGVASYMYKMAIVNADISIVPLVESEFNICKAPIKWVEQSALEVPSVVSMNSPYIEIYNGVNAIMIENNSKRGWINGISTLIDDPILRSRIAGEARRFVEENFDITKQAYRWVDAYKEAIEVKKRCETRQEVSA
jgi:glycosyltransferase involved in cell wall biosynthesis